MHGGVVLVLMAGGWGVVVAVGVMTGSVLGLRFNLFKLRAKGSQLESVAGGDGSMRYNACL